MVIVFFSGKKGHLSQETSLFCKIVVAAIKPVEGMQYSFFSAASNPKSSLFLHQKVVFHLNLGCLSRFRRKCKDTPYLSMALRITCLLATCLLTRLILPIIKTLLAAQCHLTDTQNLDSLTISLVSKVV